MPVCIQCILLNLELRFSFFFFQGTTNTVAALFIIVHALKNIKNGSHGTIHTFKNYFATVLSVFSFQFQ